MPCASHLPGNGAGLAGAVAPRIKTLAADWQVWEFAEGATDIEYDGEYGSERVWIVSGRATIEPNDGSPSFHVGPGDVVYFLSGFQCTWRVHEAPLVQRYGFFVSFSSSLSIATTPAPLSEKRPAAATRPCTTRHRLLPGPTMRPPGSPDTLSNVYQSQMQKNKVPASFVLALSTLRRCNLTVKTQVF